MKLSQWKKDQRENLIIDINSQKKLFIFFILDTFLNVAFLGFITGTADFGTLVKSQKNVK